MAITTSGTTLTFNDSTTQTTAPVNTNANVNSVSAGTGISVNSTTGAVTVTNSGVTSVAAGTGISVSASTGGVTITNSAPAVTAGEAKAWVNFVGTSTSGSATVNASYNVSSVTINGTGDFTINFSTALADNNYAMSGSYLPINNGIYGTIVCQKSGGTRTASACEIIFVNGNSATLTSNGQNIFAVFYR